MLESKAIGYHIVSNIAKSYLNRIYSESDKKQNMGQT